MNKFILRNLLRWTMFMVVFGASFIRCRDTNEIEPVQNKINYDDPLFQHIITDRQFDPQDVVDYGDFYIVEGDIMFSKADFKKDGNPGARTSQYAANYLVLSSYQDNMTIFVDPSVKTSTTNWGPAIQDAVTMWNSVSCSKVHFSEVNSSALMAITTDNGTLPETTAAFTKLPSGNGKPGNLMQINVSLSSSLVQSEKMIIVLHELGHAMGLRHTNAKSRGEFGDSNGTHLIPETNDTDANSVMNSPTNALALSNGDIKAIQNVYPEMSASCAAPFFRYYSSGASDHFYTTNFAELGAGRNGFAFTWIECHIYGAQRSGTVPLYRFYNSSKKDHLYKTSLVEPDGYNFQLTAGYIFTSSANGRIPLYAYRHSSGTDHVYTIDFNELGDGDLGYVYEGIIGYVLP